MERLGSRVERLRLEVDALGRGTALYRLTIGQAIFHYLVVSNALADNEKTDHNTGENWDVMSALCAGRWTADREVDLLRELPKQRNGRPDGNTLVYARGNRSGRLFDHVVEKLATGMQPDPARLSATGYIVRTTSFVGNGLLGMRSFEGYDGVDPLRRPYHAQICAAFLLREFVCDLVEAIARQRNGNGAVPLDIAFRRALGLGNSAGPGLVYFTANHPRLVHHWVQLQEDAITLARQNAVKAGQIEVFKALLDRASIYFGQTYPDRNGIYADPDLLADELEKLAELTGYLGCGNTWEDTITRLCANASLEMIEIVNAILLELHPDIVADCLDRFTVDETLRVDPCMTLQQLGEIVTRDYGWALELEKRSGAGQLFWYRSEDAPGDSRRGVRGVVPQVEYETPLDVIPMIAELAAEITASLPGETIGEFLLARPQLSYIVSRVQTLAGMDTAEYRADYTDPDFVRLIPPRLILSFYGMEKLDTQLPRSVRGVLLQGAPTAADITDGRKGDWPFAVFPGVGRASVAASESGRVAAKEAAIGLDTQSIVVKPPGRRRRYIDTSGNPASHIRMSPVELSRNLQKALQGAGLSLGDSIQTAELAMLGHFMREDVIRSCIDQIQVLPGSLSSNQAPAFQISETAAVDLNGRAVLADASRIGHYALAASQSQGTFAIHARRTFGMGILGPLALCLAEPGNAVFLAWRANRGFDEEARPCRALAAFGHADGSFLTDIPATAASTARATGRLDPHAWADMAESPNAAALENYAAMAMPELDCGDYAIAIAHLPDRIQEHWQTLRASLVCDAGTIRAARRDALGNGILVPRELFEKLNLLAERVRVPAPIEELIAAG